VFILGYFDQHMRHSLFTAWSNHMQQAHIQFKLDIARIEVSHRIIYLLHFFLSFQLSIIISVVSDDLIHTAPTPHLGWLVGWLVGWLAGWLAG